MSDGVPKAACNRAMMTISRYRPRAQYRCGTSHVPRVPPRPVQCQVQCVMMRSGVDLQRCQHVLVEHGIAAGQCRNHDRAHRRSTPRRCRESGPPAARAQHRYRGVAFAQHRSLQSPRPWADAPPDVSPYAAAGPGRHKNGGGGRNEGGPCWTKGQMLDMDLDKGKEVEGMEGKNGINKWNGSGKDLIMEEWNGME